MKKILGFASLVVILYLLITFCFVTCITGLSSCGSSKQVVDNTIMQYEFDTLVNKTFIDSVVVADTLAEYPDNWIYSPMVDYFTNKDVSTRIYYKDYQQSMYRIIEQENSLYQFSKRIKK